MRTTQSNETGNYIFPLLEIGEYEVICSAAGFKTQVRSGIGADRVRTRISQPRYSLTTMLT